MSLPKQDERKCDRCGMFPGKSQTIQRKYEDGIFITANVDLCVRCEKIVDNAIKRAVKAK